MQLVMRLSEDASRRGQDLEADSLAEMLVQKGHTVTVRTALGGGGGCECLRNLRHVFLSVRIQVITASGARLQDASTASLCSPLHTGSDPSSTGVGSALWYVPCSSRSGYIIVTLISGLLLTQ